MASGSGRLPFSGRSIRRIALVSRHAADGSNERFFDGV